VAAAAILVREAFTTTGESKWKVQVGRGALCRPEEALDCFLRTRMDVLVMGEHYIARSAAQ
jgi:hypothetical protein